MSSAVRYCGALQCQIASLQRQRTGNALIRPMHLLTIAAKNNRLGCCRRYHTFGENEQQSARLFGWWTAVIAGIGVAGVAVDWKLYVVCQIGCHLSEFDFRWFMFHSYCRRNHSLLPIVMADANSNTDYENSDMASETSDDESNVEEQQGKKKQKKEKVGFRDRKVTNMILNCFVFDFVLIDWWSGGSPLPQIMSLDFGNLFVFFSSDFGFSKF